MSVFVRKNRHSSPHSRKAVFSSMRYFRPEMLSQQTMIHRILHTATVQPKLTLGQANGKKENLYTRLHQNTGGQPLSRKSKKFMEPRFGADFSSVRIHTDDHAVRLSRSLHAQAFTHGRDIYFDKGKYNPHTSSGKGILAHELTHVMQQGQTQRAFAKVGGSAVSDATQQIMRISYVWPCEEKGQRVRRQKIRRQKEPKVLRDFAKKFPDAANLVRKSPEAMKLVRAAAAKGVVFGGYANKQHGKIDNAYAIGNKVYIPRIWTDKVKAMSGFVFELNNAMRKPRVALIQKIAKKRSITAKQYAYRIVSLEIESMLNTGLIWFKMRQGRYKGRRWNKYDKDFYLASYKAYKSGKKSKHDLVKEFLQRKYKTRPFVGWTVEKYYMEQYKYL